MGLIVVWRQRWWRTDRSSPLVQSGCPWSYDVSSFVRVIIIILLIVIIILVICWNLIGELIFGDSSFTTVKNTDANTITNTVTNTDLAISERLSLILLVSHNLIIFWPPGHLPTSVSQLIISSSSADLHISSEETSAMICLSGPHFFALIPSKCTILPSKRISAVVQLETYINADFQNIYRLICLWGYKRPLTYLKETSKLDKHVLDNSL